jgi:hypothetical protein
MSFEQVKTRRRKAQNEYMRLKYQEVLRDINERALS